MHRALCTMHQIKDMATDFSSLDKLIEFGLGLGIATQMMNTMNETLARTAVPGVGLNPGIKAQPQFNTVAPAIQMPREYYIVKDDKVAGPFNEKELARLVEKGDVGNQTFVWSPGMQGWKFAQDLPEVNKILLLHS